MECPIINSSDYENSIEFNETDKEDLKESIYYLIGEYVDNNILVLKHPKYIDIIYYAIMPIIDISYEPIIDSINNYSLYDLFLEASIIYFTLSGQKRHYTDRPGVIDKQYAKKQLTRINNIPQHEQNTQPWFERRWNHITASSAWKALGTESMQNSLIYSKCNPIDPNKYNNININSATHHGHKFEPLSISYYENKFSTKIAEFGCLPDETNKILAASPDGINCDPESPLYGYLLEIKNPVSRKIDGIPKLEYWIQMQFQMHVCQLHYCDFLETTFKEYETEDQFNADGTFKKTQLGNPKGIIVCFHNGDKPIYKYPKWNIDKKEFECWYENIIDENNTLTWVNNTYWYLQNYSCVTVSYNEKWFKAAIQYFEKLWNTIERERVEGYKHRVPKKRAKKPEIISPLQQTMTNKILPSLNLPPPNMILKIRTTSFEKPN